MSARPTDATQFREVIVGRNSKVWRAVSASKAIAVRFPLAIGHSELPEFVFTAADRVWVFAYSRLPQENSRLLSAVEAAQVREVVYVSTATTIVNRLTNCYQYPRVKGVAESEARSRLNARILSFGLVVSDPGQLPAGRNAMTLQSTIEEFMLNPHWPHAGGARMNLFEPIEVPFRRGWESALYRLYNSLQWRLRRWPCVLRPVDLLLRALGIRWYGYVNLSNRLWTTTTS